MDTPHFRSPEDKELVRIAIVDDHALFLSGVAMALSNARPDWPIDTFSAPQDLLDALKGDIRYDVVVCDLLMSDVNGLHLTKAITAAHKLKVVLISGINTPPTPEEVAENGAVGFVHKAADPSILLEAIDCVLSGKTFHYAPARMDTTDSPGSFGRSNAEWAQGKEPPAITGRRLEVLQLISQGASNKEVAQELEISDNTVKSHLRYIFEVLGVNKRTACVRKAKMLGLLE